MLADITVVDRIYIITGRTDMRKSIDGLCAIIKELMDEDQPDGRSRYRWPRNRTEVRNLTWKEFGYLMDGIDIEQPKAIKIR